MELLQRHSFWHKYWDSARKFLNFSSFVSNTHTETLEIDRDWLNWSVDWSYLKQIWNGKSTASFKDVPNVWNFGPNPTTGRCTLRQSGH